MIIIIHISFCFQYCDNHGKLLCTVHEHQDRVNCVRWIHGSEPAVERIFASGSADKSVIVWDCTQNDALTNCSKVAKLTGHKIFHLLEMIAIFLIFDSKEQM